MRCVLLEARGSPGHASHPCNGIVLRRALEKRCRCRARPSVRNRQSMAPAKRGRVHSPRSSSCSRENSLAQTALQVLQAQHSYEKPGLFTLCRRSVFFLPKYRVGANLKRGVYARAIYNRTTCAQGACVSRVCLAPCGCERSRPGPENESRCMCETGHPAMLMLAGPGEPMR